MSRIDELIEQMCPDGVLYKPIKKVYRRLKGTPITAGKMKEIAEPDGEIKIFAGGQTMIFAREKDIPRANITRVPAVLVQSRGIIDFVYYDQPFTFKNEMWAYTADDNTSVKFLYHVLKANAEVFRNAASGMGLMPQISLKVTEDFKVPIPPMEIQQEIVRVLDSFTELEAELEAELDARQRQYAYYRDELLDFSGRDDVQWMKLGDIGAFTRGKRFTATDYVDSGIGAIHYGEIYTQYDTSATETFSYLPESMRSKLRYAKTGDVVIAATGENVEDLCKSVAWLGDEEVAVHDDCWIFTSDVNSKFIVHALLTKHVATQKARLASNGKVSRISGKSLASISIPIPLREEQERIVEILDKFDALINDISQGLPAEIEARHKQYAYYRDKLLTFKEKVA